MYKPPPPRPKKINIVRSRDGCKQCRQRRKKCDKAKPSCGACLRLKLDCEPVQPGLTFRSVVFNDTNGRPEDTTRSTSNDPCLSSPQNPTTQCLRRDLIPQLSDWNQSTGVSGQTPRQSRVALARDENVDVFVSFIGPNHAPFTDISATSLLEEFDITSKWHATIPSIESPLISRVQGDSHFLGPGSYTREESDETTVSLRPGGTQSSSTFLALFETMPETQAYIDTTPYVDS